MAIGAIAIHGATAFLACQCLLKFLEMVLDPRQTKSVQDACDRLTLVLIDLDVLRHYTRLKERRTQRRLFALIIIAWIAAVVAFAEHGGATISDLVAFDPQDINDWMFVVGMLCFVVVMFFLFQFTMTWLVRTSTANAVLLKVFAVYVTSAIFILAVRYLHIQGFGLFVVLLPVAFIGGAFFWCGVVVLTLRLAQGFVWFFRNVMWRIATHPKGAWSALVFILTGIFATVELILKSH
jgi:hypothetical protein